MTTSPSHARPNAWSIGLGALLILSGFVAIAFPLLAGIAASIFFGWLIMLGGVTHFVYAWSERGAGAIIWQILIGVVYVIAAVSILLLPASGVAALTLILAFYIAVEGILEILLFSRWHRLPGTSWFLVDGIISLLLAGLIVLRWPSSSAWVVGTLVGISMLFSGIARFAAPMRRRKLALQI